MQKRRSLILGPSRVSQHTLIRVLAVVLTAVSLQGCLAKTALDIATAPVKVAGKAVDLATTSQSEADEKRGRDLRRREERLGKLERLYAKQLGECDDGRDEKACQSARETFSEMQELRLTIPAPPPER